MDSMQTGIMVSTSSICLHIKLSHKWWNSINGKVQQTNKPTMVKALTSKVQQIGARGNCNGKIKQAKGQHSAIVELLSAKVQMCNKPTKIKSLKSKVQQFSTHTIVKIKANMQIPLGSS